MMTAASLVFALLLAAGVLSLLAGASNAIGLTLVAAAAVGVFACVVLALVKRLRTPPQ